MAFPEDLNRVYCGGFPKVWLPAIKNAIESREVIWKGVSLYIGECKAAFEWQEMSFVLEESYELVHSIKLVNGIPPKDLILTILKN